MKRLALLICVFAVVAQGDELSAKRKCPRGLAWVEEIADCVTLPKIINPVVPAYPHTTTVKHSVSVRIGGVVTETGR